MGWTYEYINSIPMPFVFEQFDYFAKQPNYSTAEPPIARSTEPTATEMALLSGPVRPFNTLPLALQEALKKEQQSGGLN